jgi:hypothetical protein
MVTTTPHLFRRLAGVAAAVMFTVAPVACSDDDSASSDTPPPLPTAPRTTVEITETSSVPRSSATSSSSESSTTELNPVPTTPKPPSTPSTSDVSLPPVTTLVPAVDPEMLTREQRNPNSVNNSRPILPEHVPVIEAYLETIQAFTHVASTWPINPDAPELVGAPLSPASLERNREGLRETRDRSEVLNVTQGVTFRPYVVGPLAETATLFDCELAGHYWTIAETGELVPPDEIWPAGPGRIVEVGLRVNLIQREGRWLVDSSQIDPGACA